MKVLCRSAPLRARGRPVRLLVGAPREYGYHPLSTIFHAVNLFDEVSVHSSPEWGICVSVPQSLGVPEDGTNLDGPGHRRQKGRQHDLAALAAHPQDAVAMFLAKTLDVRAACFEDPQDGTKTSSGVVMTERPPEPRLPHARRRQPPAACASGSKPNLNGSARISSAKPLACRAVACWSCGAARGRRRSVHVVLMEWDNPGAPLAE